MTTQLFDESVPACADYKCAFLPHAVTHRGKAEAMWEKYSPYADRNFLSSLRTEFHARFWEMLLCTQLLEAGFQVVKESSAGPEFYITLDGKRFWVEAVSPKAGTGQDAVPPIEYGHAGTVPIDRIVLRLASALSEKLSHYRRALAAGRISPNDGYIICINPSQVPHAKFGSDPSYPSRALYGVGNLTLSIDRDSRRILDQFNVHTPSITKKSGASVATSPFFGSGEISCSAVIYSVMDFFNIDRCVSNDFGVYHNPNAARPLPTQAFGMFDQFVPEPIDESRFTLRHIPREAA
ncbi:hypothetical protein [Pseudoxanthomonas mexicana]|uniref:hypothetical protein n=1 Tax=Pseudoxanthomonas mexicana TaxID=128785 RepID=UPI001FD6A119|nr:hypothetical protein [Pseudoxanthomonas mexicana]UOV00200.1 hypothetical protein MUU73_09065 [Pseudoxanthomonas mexicana]